MKPDLKVLKREDAPKPPQDEKQSPAQGEMPFAVVDGEPITTLPQDLYIPPYALQVFLEAFEGPLDLLLYLIRRQNLDILEIDVSEFARAPEEFTSFNDFFTRALRPDARPLAEGMVVSPADGRISQIENIRGEPRFKKLMERVKREWENFEV